MRYWIVRRVSELDEKRRDDLCKLISLISNYNMPFGLDDLYDKWKHINGKHDLDSADMLLIKYVLSNMCENGQVIYLEGAYKNNRAKLNVAAAG